MSKSLAIIIGLLVAATGSSAFASAEPSLIETSNSDAARKVLADLRCDIERDLATRLDGLRRDGGFCCCNGPWWSRSPLCRWRQPAG